MKMKKIIMLLTAILFSIAGFCQYTGVPTILGSINNITKIRGGLQPKTLIIPYYTDTTAANTDTKTAYYTSSVIQCLNLMYIRRNSKWYVLGEVNNQVLHDSLVANYTTLSAEAAALYTIDGSNIFQVKTQLQNLSWLSPDGSTGKPTFRAIAKNDLPLNYFQKYNDYRSTNLVDVYNEFMTSNNDATFSTTATGTGALINTTYTSDINHPGIISLATGSTATGLVTLKSNSNSILFGGGFFSYEVLINLTTLSNATDRYQVEAGFADQLNAGTIHADGAYILYDEGGISTGSAASPNWQLVTTNNAVRSYVTSSTAVTAGASVWHKLRVEVNAAGNSVQFFVDGTLLGTTTTNIPTATGRETGYGVGIYKSAGTTNLTMQIDYFKLQNILTNAR